MVQVYPRQWHCNLDKIRLVGLNQSLARIPVFSGRDNSESPEMTDYLHIGMNIVFIALMISLAIGAIWEAVKPIVAYFRRMKTK